MRLQEYMLDLHYVQDPHVSCATVESTEERPQKLEVDTYIVVDDTWIYLHTVPRNINTS